MNESIKTRKYTNRGNIMDNAPAVLVMAFLAIALGIFFIVSQGVNKPVLREEAVSYSGKFDHYDTSWENYREIYFEDGSVYDVYPHTESNTFREQMESLEKGTVLYILVNPNNDYVIEVKTETEELLNFELSQQDIDSYDNGYIAIGIFLCVCGAFLIFYIIGSRNYKRKENERHALKREKDSNARSSVIRYADMEAKSRILLEANAHGYQICYRRVKSVNELVINGRVYDEKKGIVEFAHKLCATVDQHTVEAGYDEESYSYILFDGELIKRKKRWI